MHSQTVSVIINDDRTDEVMVITSPEQGPPGPQGQPGPVGPPGQDAGVPSAVSVANGRMLAASNGLWVDIPPPSGSGDMQSLIYDPSGRATNAFDLSNQTGILDGGVFS